jgi:thiol-disulfide isomerase/thioredoxin
MYSIKQNLNFMKTTLKIFLIMLLFPVTLMAQPKGYVKKIGKIEIPREIDGDWFSTSGDNVWVIGFRNMFQASNRSWMVDTMEKTDDGYQFTVSSGNSTANYHLRNIDHGHLEMSCNGSSFRLLKRSMGTENKRSLPYSSLKKFNGSWQNTLQQKIEISEKANSLKWAGKEYTISHISESEVFVPGFIPEENQPVLKLIAQNSHLKSTFFVQSIDDAHIIFKSENQPTLLLTKSTNSKTANRITLSRIPSAYQGDWNTDKIFSISANQITVGKKKRTPKSITFSPKYLEIRFNKNEELRCQLIDNGTCYFIYNRDTKIATQYYRKEAVEFTSNNLPAELKGLWFLPNGWFEFTENHIAWNNELIHYSKISLNSTGYYVQTDKGTFHLEVRVPDICNLKTPKNKNYTLVRDKSKAFGKVTLPNVSYNTAKTHFKGYISNMELIKNQYFDNFKYIEVGTSNWLESNYNYKTFRVSSNGFFEFDLDITGNQTLAIRYGSSSFVAYVEPAKDCFIRINGKDAISHQYHQAIPLLTSGNSMPYTHLFNALDNLQYTMYDHINQYSSKIDLGTPININEISKKLTEKLWQNIEDDYSNIDPELKKLIKSYLYLQSMSNLNSDLSYAYYKKHKKRIDLVDKNTSFKSLNYLKSLPVMPDGWELTDELVSLALMSQAENLRDNLKGKTKEEKSKCIIAVFKQFLKNNPNIPVEYFIHYFTKPHIKSLNFSEAQKIYNATKDLLTDSDSKLAIETELAKTEKAYNALKLPENSHLFNCEKDNSIDNLNEILKKYKGKVIYLDVWATWCAPCMREMRFTPSLKKNLKGKDVVFLYLAVSTPAKTWRNIICKEHIAGEHYLLNKKLHKELSKKYELKGIPHFALFDKNGKLIENKTLRPSSGKEIQNKIEKLL